MSVLLWCLTYNCEQSKLSRVFNGTDFLSLYIYIIYTCIMCKIMFQAARRAVNVLKLMFPRIFKYPPNAIFRNANTCINAQRANVTGSMNRHNTQPRPPM